jgi:hypothetical protein
MLVVAVAVDGVAQTFLELEELAAVEMDHQE